MWISTSIWLESYAYLSSLLPSFVSPLQLYAVLTVNSILVYDTQHFYPLAIVRNTHLASLTDAAWYILHSTIETPQIS